MIFVGTIKALNGILKGGAIRASRLIFNPWNKFFSENTGTLKLHEKGKKLSKGLGRISGNTKGKFSETGQRVKTGITKNFDGIVERKALDGSGGKILLSETHGGNTGEAEGIILGLGLGGGSEETLKRMGAGNAFGLGIIMVGGGFAGFGINTLSTSIQATMFVVDILIFVVQEQRYVLEPSQSQELEEEEEDTGPEGKEHF
ncbi:LOW QUALITY PROTEIN: hypothetical protein X943_002140 [Babesia divergens]|uniref:Uncharacterized protein n=1 Tax=Babesia divergens TaxID=32595 RepID=A0AAD9G733_BABDI|nr:LOW QUALITY PROTEIN: hypothetical protein X943_002140 [Babesia divergens]